MSTIDVFALLRAAPQPNQVWSREVFSERAGQLSTGSHDLMAAASKQPQPDLAKQRGVGGSHDMRPSSSAMRPSMSPAALSSAGQLPGWQFGQIGEPAALETSRHPMSAALPSSLGLWQNSSSGFVGGMQGTHQMW
jgi:hypothetical protein